MKENIPRRFRLDLMKPSELAIRKAIHEVEDLGADIKLTDIVNLLIEANNKVSDYLDELENILIKQKEEEEEEVSEAIKKTIEKMKKL